MMKVLQWCVFKSLVGAKFEVSVVLEFRNAAQVRFGAAGVLLPKARAEHSLHHVALALLAHCWHTAGHGCIISTIVITPLHTVAAPSTKRRLQRKGTWLRPVYTSMRRLGAAQRCLIHPTLPSEPQLQPQLQPHLLQQQPLLRLVKDQRHTCRHYSTLIPSPTCFSQRYVGHSLPPL